MGRGQPSVKEYLAAAIAQQHPKPLAQELERTMTPLAGIYERMAQIVLHDMTQHGAIADLQEIGRVCDQLLPCNRQNQALNEIRPRPPRISRKVRPHAVYGRFPARRKKNRLITRPGETRAAAGKCAPPSALPDQVGCRTPELDWCRAENRRAVNQYSRPLNPLSRSNVMWPH